eukprot:SAG11_NODE_696_length_7693_cov_9.962339_11_plen_47_part_00
MALDLYTKFTTKRAENSSLKNADLGVPFFLTLYEALYPRNQEGSTL